MKVGVSTEEKDYGITAKTKASRPMKSLQPPAFELGKANIKQ